MKKYQIKGHEFTIHPVRDSANRRSLQFQNEIIKSLKKIGIITDDIDIPLEPVAIKNVPASITFWFDYDHLYYSYAKERRFVDNLQIVAKIIELEVDSLLNEKKTRAEFVSSFESDTDVVDQRKEAREFLGVAQDCMDLKVINSKFKAMAKTCHPDSENSDVAKFKALNRAYTLLKKELQ